MYGHIHIILKDLVLSLAGIEQWEQVLRGVGLCSSEAEAEALDTVAHSDELTLALVANTSAVLGLTVDQALSAFGGHLVCFALRSGSASVLKSMGATLPAFLANVNTLHACFEREHPNARFPLIDSSFDPKNDSVYLTYLSMRLGLKALVVGMIEEVGVRLFGVNVTMEPAEVPRAHRTYGDGAAAWRVRRKLDACRGEVEAPSRRRPKRGAGAALGIQAVADVLPGASQLHDRPHEDASERQHRVLLRRAAPR